MNRIPGSQKNRTLSERMHRLWGCAMVLLMVFVSTWAFPPRIAGRLTAWIPKGFRCACQLVTEPLWNRIAGVLPDLEIFRGELGEPLPILTAAFALALLALLFMKPHAADLLPRAEGT